MKINLDDPNLTAFALGELSGPERAAMEQAVASSPDAQKFVAETQQFARMLKSEYAAEQGLPQPRSANILRMEEERRAWSSYQWGSLAAALAIFAVISAFAISTIVRNGSRTVSRMELTLGNEEDLGVTAVTDASVDAKVATTPEHQDLLAMQQPAPPPPEQELKLEENAKSASAGEYYSRDHSKEVHREAGGIAAIQGPGQAPATKPMAMAKSRAPENEPEIPGRYRQDFDTATYDHVSENPFLQATTNPLSTFSIDVDTASYSNARRFINSGSLPPKDAVRVEEMINYFSYDYREPEGDKPFSIDLDSTACPWDDSHRLLRIGLKGREVANEKRPASNLVFLLDVSGSMTPAERLPLVKQAMRLLVEKLTEKDRVAIVIYAGGSGLALPSTTGDRKEVILSALEDLKAGGSTNGAEGIELAYKVAADNFIKGGVNRVILATDGDFNIGVTNQGDLIRLIEEKAKTGVFLSVLGVGTDNLKDSTMQKLADKGNGNYAYLDSVDEARKVLGPTNQRHTDDDRQGREDPGRVQSGASRFLSIDWL